MATTVKGLKELDKGGFESLVPSDERREVKKTREKELQELFSWVSGSANSLLDQTYRGIVALKKQAVAEVDYKIDPLEAAKKVRDIYHGSELSDPAHEVLNLGTVTDSVLTRYGHVRLADFALLPRKGFEYGVPTALRGGAYAVQISGDKEFGEEASAHEGITAYVVVPASRRSPARVIEPGVFPYEETYTTTQTGSVRGLQQVGVSGSEDSLGRPITDPELTRQIMNFTEEVCLALSLKAS